jgi:hypothetical protein
MFCFSFQAQSSGIQTAESPKNFALSASKGEVWELLGTLAPKIREPLLDLEPFVEKPSGTWLFDSLQL